MQPQLLLYHIQPERTELIKALCLPLRILVKTVAKEQYLWPIGALTGMAPAGKSVYLGPELSEEMMVMAEFSQDLLDRFLALWRTTGLSPIALKCIVTPTNATWDSLALHHELCREREQFQKNRQKTQGR